MTSPSAGPGVRRADRASEPSDASGPRVSLVVGPSGGAHREADALHTLSPRFQREIARTDCEVVVVSGPDEGVVEVLGRCRAEHAGVMLGGLRMLTPRVVRYALDAFAMDPDGVVTVPGYRLPTVEAPPEPATDGGPEAAPDAREDASLPRGWRRHGYRLFEAARVERPAARALFRDPGRAGFVLAPTERLVAAVGAAEESSARGRARADRGAVDRRADRGTVDGATDGAPAGGGRAGSPGPELVRDLLERAGGRWILLPGEGAFRPGSDGRGDGTATGETPDAEEAQERPFLLGAVPGPALPFVMAAARPGARFHPTLPD